MLTKEPRGYIFPDPYDPHDIACFRVYVPRHAFYLGAFWRAYEFFTTWLAWARDPLHTGSKVAALWQVLFDQARREYELNGGNCMPNITGIRNSPLDPCKIEAQYDGGAWVQVIDVSCCGGGGGGGCGDALRIGPDGSIERYDPETGKWKPTAPGQIPSTADTVPPAFPDDPAGRCMGASGMVKEVKSIEEKILVMCAASVGVEEMLAQIGGILAGWTGAGWPVTLVLEVLNGLLASGSGVITATLAEENNAELLCVFFPHVGPDGKLLAGHQNALRNDLISEGQRILSESGIEAYPLAWWFLDAAVWVQILGAAGLDKAASLGTPDDADECNSCPWEVFLDFRKGKYGFDLTALSPDNIYPGKYIAGQGWKTGRNITIGDEVRPIIHAQEFSITQSSIRYIGHHTNSPPNNYDIPGIHFVGLPGGSTEQAITDGQKVTFVASDGGTYSTFVLLATCSFSGGHIEGDTIIEAVWLKGTGPIPPAWADAVVQTGHMPTD